MVTFLGRRGSYRRMESNPLAAYLIEGLLRSFVVFAIISDNGGTCGWKHGDSKLINFAVGGFPKCGTTYLQNKILYESKRVFIPHHETDYLQKEKYEELKFIEWIFGTRNRNGPSQSSFRRGDNLDTGIAEMFRNRARQSNLFGCPICAG